MADRDQQNPIDALLQELISSRRSSTSFFEDLDSSSFVEEFLKISSSRLNESVRELIEFLGKSFSDENIRNLSRRIERARIPTPDKRALGEGLYISSDIKDILTELAVRLDDLGDQSESLRKELDFLINSFDELKTYAGKNLREFIQEYQEILDTQKESLEGFIEETGGVRQFGRYFYLSKLDRNQYREESYLISQPEFFRSFEDYIRLVGPEALFKSTESLIKSAVEDIKFTSSLSFFIRNISTRERIFNPDIPVVTDFYRNIFRRIPQELAQAKQFTNAGLLELNERINTLLKAPESERDYISLSKLVTQREELQKRLLALLREEIELRQEFNRRTYGVFLEASKDFGLRAADRIFSTTRNPFIDIFTDSLRFALDIGTRVYSGTRNFLDFIPIEIPRGGASRRPPTGPARPSSPSNKPSSPGPTTSPRTTIPPILRGAGRVAGGAAVGLAFGVAEDIIFEKKSFKEAITSPSNIGTAIGVGFGTFFGVPGVIVGGILGNYIGGLFEKDRKNTNVREISLKELAEKTSRPTTLFTPNIPYDPSTLKILNGPTEKGREELPFLVTQASLQNLGLSALAASGSLDNLGISAGKLSINFGELAKTSASFGVGLISAAGAFVVDFYLQSMNKAYDIYYQQFAQQNLIPQIIRRQLGTTTAEISRNLVTPGTGLLFQGPLSVAGLGFERTELLAGASRVSSQVLIRNAEDLATRLKEAANVARIFGTNLEQGVEAIALLRKATLNYSDLFITSYTLTRNAPTPFTKEMAEAIIRASLSLSLQQGANPRQYLESFERVQTLFITSSNRTLAELARNNIELSRNFVNSFNEFIRRGLSTPMVGGIAIRAGLTPRSMLLGATPESTTRIIRQLSLELGLPGSLVGGQFSGQAREYLLPIIQNLLGLTNIPPDAFNEIVRAVITGRDVEAQRLIREAQKQPIPSAIPSDRDFAKNIDQLNISYQNLTNVLSKNIDAITKLNEAINNLSIRILDAGDRVVPLILYFLEKISQELGLIKNTDATLNNTKSSESTTKLSESITTLSSRIVGGISEAFRKTQDFLGQIPQKFGFVKDADKTSSNAQLLSNTIPLTSLDQGLPLRKIGAEIEKEKSLMRPEISGVIDEYFRSLKSSTTSKQPSLNKEMIDNATATLLSPKASLVQGTVAGQTKAQGSSEPLVTKEMIDRASSILSSSSFPYSGYALVKIEKVPEQFTTQFIETLMRSYNKRGGK